MQLALSLFIWIVLGLLTSYFAQQRGRDPTIWFFVGLLLGILGLILVFILPSTEDADAPTHPEEGREVQISPISVEVEEAPSELLPGNYKNLQWYYLSDKQEQVGPLSFDEIKGKWNDGLLDESTFLWCEGMPEWHTVGELGLFTS